MKDISPQARRKLETARNIWLSSVRPDGRPHLVPIWFAWHADKVYVCTDPSSVKGRNILQNPRMALALEDGDQPVICEGRAAVIPAPWPQAVMAVFRRKYDWDISSEGQYTELIEVTPDKWLTW
jgi:PPOX class probable F420-dependent enzyme